MRRWTMQLLEEFFRQGDKERTLGLPFSPLCDRNNTLVAESQIGFIEFIVEPSMQVCSDMLESVLAPLNLKTDVLPEPDAGKDWPWPLDYLVFLSSPPYRIYHRVLQHRLIYTTRDLLLSTSTTSLVSGGIMKYFFPLSYLQPSTSVFPFNLTLIDKRKKKKTHV